MSLFYLRPPIHKEWETILQEAMREHNRIESQSGTNDIVRTSRDQPLVDSCTPNMVQTRVHHSENTSQSSASNVGSKTRSQRAFHRDMPYTRSEHRAARAEVFHRPPSPVSAVKIIPVSLPQPCVYLNLDSFSSPYNDFFSIIKDLHLLMCLCKNNPRGDKDKLIRQRLIKSSEFSFEDIVSRLKCMVDKFLLKNRLPFTRWGLEYLLKKTIKSKFMKHIHEYIDYCKDELDNCKQQMIEICNPSGVGLTYNCEQTDKDINLAYFRYLMRGSQKLEFLCDELNYIEIQCDFFFETLTGASTRPISDMLDVCWEKYEYYREYKPKDLQFLRNVSLGLKI